MTAVISAKISDNSDLFAGAENSLLAQAGAVPGRFQDDGWGVGYFTPAGVPALIKSPRPARLEKAAFIRAAAKASARVSLAHVRDASNPGKVNKALLLGLPNTQPFAAKGYLFAHNGTLYIKEEIKSLLGKYAAEVKGLNDSEVLFWQVIKMLDLYGTPEKALEMALDEIRTVWVSCKDKYPGLKAPYRGLNIFLATKASLTVLCHYQGRKTALMTPGRDFGAIAWRRDKDRLVFSSEPADRLAGWKKMSDLQIASATAGGLKFSKLAGRFQ